MAASLQTNGQRTIPTLWRERILKRDFEIVLGKMLQSDQGRKDETEESYLRSANVQWEGLDLSDVKTMWFSSAEKRDLLLREGDLVVNEGGDVGRCAIWGGISGSFYFQNAINRVRARTLASTRFLYYWLYNLKYAGFIDAMVSRITIAHLTAEKLARVPWPDVPSADQQRIAVYLDASCAAIDAAVAAKCRQLETLDALRKSIVHRAVTNGLNPAAPRRASGVAWFGEIPQHWRCEHLKRFTKRIQAGMTPPTTTPEYYFDGTIPWFAPGSFNGDIDLREPRKLINELARSEGELRIFPTETVFLVGIGATIGRVGLVSAEASCNQQLIGIVCGHRMHSRFLAYQFKIYEDVIPGIATATTLPIFDQVKTGYLPTLQPPREEQKSICAFLDTKLAESKQIIAGIETQIATLTAYRKSLIHECVTGQRRITEVDLKQVAAHG